MSGREDNLKDQKCITPTFRVSFPALSKPKAFKGQEPKFEVTMLFQEKTDLTVLKRALAAAMKETFGPDQKKWPKVKHPIFRNGSKEKPDQDGYKGHIFVRVSSKEGKPPQLLGTDGEPLLDPSEIYAGCYAKASLIAWAQKNEFGVHAGFSLQAVKKVGDGKRFGGGVDARNENWGDDDLPEGAEQDETGEEEGEYGF